MFIGNVTAGQISNLVWTATTRTLTADLLQELAEESIFPLQPQTVLNSTSFGAYVQIVASAAHNVRAVEICARANTVVDTTYAIAVGGAGSEVNKLLFRFPLATNAQTVWAVRFVDTSIFAKGSRVSIAAACGNNVTAAYASQVGVTLIEDNA